MEIFMSVLTAVGGLAFFLFGMNMLGASLEKAAGGKMQQALEKMTSNVVKSLLLGILVTAAIQSSSATTVIVVGLVNAGILRLRNAIGVIMGANIGTTVTSLILSLADPTHAQTSNVVLNLFKPATLTPVIALVAIVILMTAKKSRTRLVSEIMFGFAILFNGMMIMTDALEPLSELPAFSQIFQTLSNPFVGLLAGTLITAIIQSSSASVAILQTAASTGLVPFSAAVPIILGQNIGTCVTSLLSSIGANKNARRAAMVHLYFNIIGTVIFFIGMYAIQWTIGFSFWNDPVSMSGISYFHITFNVLTTLLLLPFTRLLEKLAVLTIRDKKSVQGEDEDVPVVAVLDSRFLLSPSLALSHVKEVVEQMGEYAKKNFGQYKFSAYCSYLGTKDHGISKIKNEDGVIHILSCSNVVPVKRVSLILKSLLLIPDRPIQWTHIGGGKGFNALQQQLQQLPANLTVNLTGAITNREVIGHYLHHPVDIFVNVSASEGLPVSIMEAISFNIPVIATNVGGTNEIVTSESGVLLDPHFSAQELADQIVRVYEHKDRFHPRRLWEEKFNAGKNYPRFISQILND